MQQHVANWREKTQHSHVITLFTVLSLTACVSSYHNELNSQTQLQLGLTYLHLQRYQVAEEYLNKATLSNTTHLSAQTALAYLYQLMGRSHEAKQLYQQLIKTHPNSPELYNNYGVLLCQQGQYKKAVVEFNMALTYDAKNTSAKKNSALCKTNANKP